MLHDTLPHAQTLSSYVVLASLLVATASLDGGTIII